jgi:hypothetical protein
MQSNEQNELRMSRRQILAYQICSEIGRAMDVTPDVYRGGMRDPEEILDEQLQKIDDIWERMQPNPDATALHSKPDNFYRRLCLHQKIDDIWERLLPAPDATTHMQAPTLRPSKSDSLHRRMYQAAKDWQAANDSSRLVKIFSLLGSRLFMGKIL